MKLSSESLLGLRRHFLGSLRGPSPFWLVPAPEPRLLLASQGSLQADAQGCLVDFGKVESPGREQRILRITNLGSEPVALELRHRPSWLTARWRQGDEDRVLVEDGQAELELIAEHGFLEDRYLDGSVQISAARLDGEELIATLSTRLATHRSKPVGQYDFQGSSQPRPFDFGLLDPAASGPEALSSFAISFQNLTSVPLKVTLSDLPAWLVLEVDGYQRRGPAAGRFFERNAPFQVEIRPVRNLQHLGSHSGRLLLETNDYRAELQRVVIPVSARIESSKPHIRLEPLEPLYLFEHEVRPVEIEIENWGRSPGRISLKYDHPWLQLQETCQVPGSQNGKPGRARLTILISAQGLAPGSHSLTAELQVMEGEPREIAFPVQVTVNPAASQVMPPDSNKLGPPVLLAAAVLVILLVLLSLVFNAFSG